MNIKRLRESYKMTQSELASKLNVSRSTVAMWELDVATPRLDKLIKLADLFGCTIDELVRGVK